MSGRPSRSSSIPIPRSSSTSLPSLDDVISMPFSNSPLPLPRPRIHSGIGSQPSLQSPSFSTSPPSRPTSRSYTSGPAFPAPARSVVAAGTTTQAFTGHGPYTPRIISASNLTSGPSASWADVACSPPPPSTSPTRGRRPSGGAGALRLPTTHRPPHAYNGGPANTTSTSTPTPAPFPRPAYLEHSALRHLLQTELPPHLPPSRYGAPPASVWPYQTTRDFTPATDSDEESTASPPPRGAPGNGASRAALESVAMVGSSPVFRLPTRWSEQDRHIHLSVSADGRELTYSGGSFSTGGSASLDNAGMARTNHPIPPACGIYYYEVEILSKGQKSQVSVGFTTGNSRLNKLPGWEKDSWGYHGDDGNSFTAEKQGSPYGPTFGGGDVIGAGIDFTKNRAFFTKNGTLIGLVFHGVAQDKEVFPSVGLRHASEGVRVNFGHAPFRYDIDDHVQQRRDEVWRGIQRSRIDWRVLEPGRPQSAAAPEDSDADEPLHGTPPADEGREEAGRLILNYLVHHGYARTAEAFEAQLARKVEPSDAEAAASPALPVPPPLQPEPDADSPMPDAADADAEGGGVGAMHAGLATRLAIVHAVQRGNIDGALTGLRARFADVLARDAGLVLLKLRCRKFVELVNDAAARRRRVAENGNGAAEGVDGDGDAVMEVDEGAGAGEPPRGAAEDALRAAIAYGQSLRADYKRDARREVQALLERTFGVVAYHFPMEAGGAVGKWAGQEARNVLAGEVNQAILESQGWPARPALERVYRQTQASLVQLGFLGVGAAVYADVQRELLDD